MRSDKVSVLISSSTHEEDHSFNKLSCVKRLDNKLKLALIDEEKFYIYDVRQTKQPWY